jgi:aminotransferase
MPDVISLGVGEPDFITPWGIRDAGIKSVQKGDTQYTPNKGLSRLREAICAYLNTRFSLVYDPDKETVVTVGASEAIDIAVRAVCDEGDEVLIPAPSYVSYAPLVAVSGGVPREIVCTEKDDFKLTAAALQAAITDKTKVLIFPFPNNPTGAVMEKEYVETLLPIIKKHNLLVISDEIYAELTYGGTHVSIASFDGMKERCIVINGFSKAFAMTGWRIGYAVGPAEIIAAMVKIHQYCIMCAPTASQYAALYALVQGEKEDYATVAEMREQYDLRRRFVVQSFNDLGLHCFTPRGAFYAFPCVKSTGMTGQTFAEKLLYAEKVAAVPGDVFGSSGEYFLRCSYATGMKNLQIALDRIEHFIKKNKV